MNVETIVAGALVVGVLAGAPAIAPAQTAGGIFGLGSASVTFGPYVRLEAGSLATDFSDGHWLPPGYPTDPRVDFDLADGHTGFGGIAVGYDWMNGFRGDVSVIKTGRSDATGPHTTPGPHADITEASVSTTALMGNLFYSPLEQRGVNSRVQPFVVGGIGLANNRVSSWTRTNSSTTPVTRSFEGDNNTDLAVSVGVGVSVQLTPPGEHPAILELAYRYYHFGTANGGSVPLAGGSEPVEPLTFDNNAGVVSLSLRIPLNRL
ncbi:outer membrane protein [Thioclava atlantica]|uniref:Outer membrane protein beta-barrel domain-containing protein n=1 Tax=Thioclava atlantica TaxID=1317124 RepID=A0A085TXJ2_9RHOB|nr:outer membrane beta-barrel protein [Thioclava atlantica]KFE35439.1 hypothetical protein DW2_08417 [Thioclava atlantica]